MFHVAKLPQDIVVFGVTRGPFGIFDRDLTSLGGARWSVTHLPTGRCVAESDNGFACLHLVERILVERPGAFDGVREVQAGDGQLAAYVRELCVACGVRFGCSRDRRPGDGRSTH